LLSPFRLSNSSCPLQVSLEFDDNLSKLPLSSTDALSNSTHQEAISGNCTNNLTAPDSLRHPPTTNSAESEEEKLAGGPHQPIATFDEWTKEKLKQEHRKVLPPSPTAETGIPNTRTQQLPPGSAATRNYASKECGAKVLLSNPEAENTKAILNEKEKDEYMRNPCEKAKNKFVVVELCETIQPRSIELANYELFSSGPKTIRLWSAERFPTGEWQLLTELNAVDSRQIQQFPVPTNGVYVKFMKVELVSHYGNEHYCTLSVLKILGISMVDEYEAEAEAASAVHSRKNLDSSSEPVVNNTSVEGPDAIAPTPTPSATVAQQSLQEVVPKDETKSPGAKEEVSEPNPTVIGLVDEVSGRLMETLVNVVKDNFGGGNNAVPRQPKWNHIRRIPSAFSACYFCPSDGMYIYPRQFCQAFVWKSSSPPTPTVKRNQMVSPERELTLKRIFVSSNRARRTRFALLQRKSLQRLQPSIVIGGQTRILLENDKQQQQLSRVAMDAQNNARSGNVVQSDVLPASSMSHKESVFMKLNKRIAALELNMSLSSEYLSELSRQYVAQTDEHQKHMRQAKKVVEEAVETLYARVNETLAEKESVFMKLNKRIAALELNMSLSSEYLSELSRQYVAQTDEHQKHMRQAKKVVEEAVETLSFGFQIALLRKEVDTLSEWLSSMRATAFKLTVSRFTKGEETPVNEKCILQQTDLHRYSPPDDGLWTTEQVVYMVVSTQLVTVLILALLSFCYQRFATDRGLSDDQRLLVEDLINERVTQVLERNNAMLQVIGKSKLTRTQHRSPSRSDDVRSLCTGGSEELIAECSSSSHTTISDDSSPEDVPMSNCTLLPSKRRMIPSMALVT
uniref:Chromosome 1 open reading frame 9 (inferred by orthology to a human protein) n=1 Tax=Nippostrongylus brasiliensis TaxID=27835 RepID=A0A0N4Y9L7_NIPBR